MQIDKTTSRKKLNTWRHAAHFVLGAALILTAALPAAVSADDLSGTFEALAGEPVFIIQADGAAGQARLEVSGSELVITDGGLDWTLSEPVTLVDEQTGKEIALLTDASLSIPDSGVVTLNFLVTTVAAANFNVTSASIPITPTDNARGRASAALAVTDTNGDGVSYLGTNGDSQHYQAFFNDVSGSASGTSFATLGSDLSSADSYDSLTTVQEFPAAPGFSTTAESGGALGTVSSMSSQFKFSVGAGTSASGTSVFVIAPPPPPTIQITAESTDGRAEASVVLSSVDVQGTTLTWARNEPVTLSDSRSGQVVATIDAAEVMVTADATVVLSFLVATGASPVLFTVTSAGLDITPIPNATAYASAGITVTDTSDDGAAITGQNSDSQVYQAFYNHVGGVPATGSTFATLQDGISTATAYASNSSSAEFAAGAFSSTNETGAALGTVSSISAQFQFGLGANDSASATSVFAIAAPAVPVELQTFEVD